MHPGAAQPSILPLPAHVVAHIKSSTAIVSLGHVVLELLKNSLDAHAASVDLVVDFARGACTAEDDGQGIPPLEFRENGGLGKLYRTSKYHLHDSSLGRHGTFLASLAAMSLVTISSHHHQHRSTNAITFHHAKAVQRELPASAHNLVHAQHGTRVMVRNLFGNLPVRVKHRSIALHQKTEYDRSWAALKRDMAALLLGWRGTASIRVRDASNKSIFHFNTSQTVIEWGGPSQGAPTPRPAQLTSMLNILTQAAYISIDEWASWVPASASTNSISIKGAISLLPAPSKNVQFISLGMRPLLAASDHNELFDQVNRLVALSSFGTTQDDDVDQVEAARRKSDKRYKNPEYTNRQLKARRDVDRHPMFCLRITLKDSQNEKTLEDQLLESETSLQAVLEVMSAMIRQWLSVHHFRPRLPRKKSARSVASSASMSEKDQTGDAAPPPASEVSHNSRSSQVSRSNSTSTASTKKKRATKTIPQESSQKVQRTAFAEWSRIKSGKADFFSNLTALPKPMAKATSSNDQTTNFAPSTSNENLRGFQVEPIQQGAFSFAVAHEGDSEAAIGSLDKNNQGDETICWVDPATKKSFMLNARTGSVMANAQPRRQSEPIVPIFSNTLHGLHKSLRLAPRSAGAMPGKRLWLDQVLQTWDNPVFKSSEPRIQRAFSKGQEMENSCSHTSQYGHSHLNTKQDFSGMSASNSSKLSKEGLRNAQVIAQVDKKFILAKMPNSLSSDPSPSTSTELLVLIDQHAADERVQVEQLWQDFCQPASCSSTQTSNPSNPGHKSPILSTPLEKRMQFSVSAQEYTHFTTHAPRFAAWGILYDTHAPKNRSTAPSKPASQTTTTTTTTTTTNQKTLSVSSLPPLILTRCTTDAKVLISTLRSMLWYFESNDSLPHFLPRQDSNSSSNNPSTLPPPSSNSSSSASTTTTAPWLHRMSTSPPALTDLINSRACRSAIMFNDALSLQECTALVERLSACVFPFMCAHGRPSMAPLGALGSVGCADGRDEEGVREDGGAEKRGESFVGAWRDWKSRERKKQVRSGDPE